MRRELEILEEERVGRLVALGRVLSDPIRVRMLGMMAEGRSCCELPDRGAPVDSGEETLGICVCEFEEYFGMGQSKVSYHVGKLKGRLRAAAARSREALIEAMGVALSRP